MLSPIFQKQLIRRDDLASALGYSLDCMAERNIKIKHNDAVVWTARSLVEVDAFLHGVRYQRIENKRALAVPVQSKQHTHVPYWVSEDGKRTLCKICLYEIEE